MSLKWSAEHAGLHILVEKTNTRARILVDRLVVADRLAITPKWEMAASVTNKGKSQTIRFLMEERFPLGRHKVKLYVDDALVLSADENPVPKLVSWGLSSMLILIVVRTIYQFITWMAARQ